MVPTAMVEDIKKLVGKRPELFRDVVGWLRHSWRGPVAPASVARWRNINERNLERELKELGFCFGYRPHASGNAVYVWTAPFSVVTDWYGKEHTVVEI